MSLLNASELPFSKGGGGKCLKATRHIWQLEGKKEEEKKRDRDRERELKRVWVCVRKREREIEIESMGEREREREGQREREGERQTDRQTERLIEYDKMREREREREREKDRGIRNVIDRFVPVFKQKIEWGYKGTKITLVIRLLEIDSRQFLYVIVKNKN